MKYEIRNKRGACSAVVGLLTSNGAIAGVDTHNGDSI